MMSPQWLGSLPDVPQRNVEPADLRRRAGRDAGRRQPGRPGRARRVRVRVVHARQRQRVPRRAQRGLLAGPERHHRRGPPVPRRHRGRRGRRHRQPGQRPARRPVRRHPHRERRHHQPVPRGRRVRDDRDEPLRRHRLHHAERRRRATPIPRAQNAASPLLNVHCRRALAHATDQQRLAEERGAGLVQPANGPFPPGSVGYLEDTGYPAYDPDAAAAEMDTCLSELGTGHDRVHVQHHERPVQRRDQHARHLDVAGGVRRPGAGDDHADRAGPVHRPRPRRCVPGPRLAQPQRSRSRTSSGCGGRAPVRRPDRPAGAQLRPLQRRRHGRRA